MIRGYENATVWICLFFMTVPEVFIFGPSVQNVFHRMFQKRRL